MTTSKTILAIESSCDETAVCIMKNYQVLSHQIYSQIKEHQKFHGVVPQLASSLHMQHLRPLIEKSLIESSCTLQDIDAFAATTGPGLINSLMIGTIYAKMFAGFLNKPFIGINHLEAHVLSPMISNSEIQLPYLILLISGGHSQFVIAKDIGKYEILGTTRDDAVGECFDKVAKLLNLDYPGGPEIEKIAKLGDENRFEFPIALKDNSCDMSFSGIKTFVLNLIKKHEQNLEEVKFDIAASFQKGISDNLSYKLNLAIKKYLSLGYKNPQFVIAGGVAANKYLVEKLKNTALQNNFFTHTPPIHLCTDNGIMVAFAATKYYEKAKFSDLNFPNKSKWPLDTL